MAQYNKKHKTLKKYSAHIHASIFHKIISLDTEKRVKEHEANGGDDGKKNDEMEEKWEKNTKQHQIAHNECVEEKANMYCEQQQEIENEWGELDHCNIMTENKTPSKLNMFVPYFQHFECACLRFCCC